MTTQNIKHILEVEGVNSKGYGIISQASMFDIDLSIQSKAIYAYFVSYTGAGRTIFPKRETILSDLKMSKNAYYKHLKPLIENGYIKISKAKGFKNKNVYTICNNPKKVKCYSSDNKSADTLSLDGINANGFGFIPKLIMCDNRLTIKAKGLIAFFYSLVQAGCGVFPHRATICTFLNISKDVYYNALNQLIEYNYITVKQRHTKHGRFAVNDYILNSNPSSACSKDKDIESNNRIDKNEALPCPKNCDNIKNSLTPKDLPCLENEDIMKMPINSEGLPCPKNEDIKQNYRFGKNETLPCPGNCDNNNSTNNNSSNNISSSNLNVSYIVYTQNPEEIRQEIFALTRYDEYSSNTDTVSRQYCKIVKALVEMLCVKNFAVYSNRPIKTIDLFDYLNDCIDDDIDGLSLRDLILQTLWHYDLAESKYNIRNKTAYLKTLLWDEIYNFNL